METVLDSQRRLRSIVFTYEVKQRKTALHVSVYAPLPVGRRAKTKIKTANETQNPLKPVLTHGQLRSSPERTSFSSHSSLHAVGRPDYQGRGTRRECQDGTLDRALHVQVGGQGLRREGVPGGAPRDHPLPLRPLLVGATCPSSFASCPATRL
jgi:hypothetical protein